MTSKMNQAGSSDSDDAGDTPDNSKHMAIPVVCWDAATTSETHPHDVHPDNSMQMAMQMGENMHPANSIPTAMGMGANTQFLSTIQE